MASAFSRRRESIRQGASASRTGRHQDACCGSRQTGRSRHWPSAPMLAASFRTPRGAWSHRATQWRSSRKTSQNACCSSPRRAGGSMTSPPMPLALGQGGSLWRISNGGDIAQYYDGIKLTNGIGVSPDGAWLYHNDTGAKCVWASGLTGDGIPGNRRWLHQFQGESPDGMAIDESGYVWIALIGSGRLARLTPEGAVDQVVEGPSDWIASICFDGRDIYAVTFGGAPYDPERSGGIYRARAEVAGAVIHPAQV